MAHWGGGGLLRQIKKNTFLCLAEMLYLTTGGQNSFPDARPIKKSLKLSHFPSTTGLISSDVVGRVFGIPEACKRTPCVTVTHIGMMTLLQTADDKLIFLQKNDIVS